MKDFTIELTQLKKIYEVNNCYCHNFYYIQYGKIYDISNQNYKRFKYIFWFDLEDIAEYYNDEEAPEKEYFSPSDIKDYAEEIAFATLESNKDLINSFSNCAEFINFCNETINRYNRILY